MKYFIFLTMLVLLIGCGDSGAGDYEDEDTDSNDIGDSADQGDSDTSTDGTDPVDGDSKGTDPTDSDDLVPSTCTSDTDCNLPPDDFCSLLSEDVVVGYEIIEGFSPPAFGSHDSTGYLMHFYHQGICRSPGEENLGYTEFGEIAEIPVGECLYSLGSPPFTFCGDVNGCIEVADGDDYCDETVHTPCQETGCYWLPEIGVTSNSSGCVGELEGFDPNTLMTYKSTLGTCLDDGYCEYEYTTEVCALGCGDDKPDACNIY